MSGGWHLKTAEGEGRRPDVGAAGKRNMYGIKLKNRDMYAIQFNPEIPKYGMAELDFIMVKPAKAESKLNEIVEKSEIEEKSEITETMVVFTIGRGGGSTRTNFGGDFAPDLRFLQV